MKLKYYKKQFISIFAAMIFRFFNTYTRTKIKRPKITAHESTYRKIFRKFLSSNPNAFTYNCDTHHLFFAYRTPLKNQKFQKFQFLYLKKTKQSSTFCETIWDIWKKKRSCYSYPPPKTFKITKIFLSRYFRLMLFCQLIQWAIKKKSEK